METVYMRHPGIGGDPVAVPKSSVPHYTAGGWQECDPPAPRMRPSKQQNIPSTRTERRRTTRSSKED